MTPPLEPVPDSPEVALARTVAREEVASLCGLVLHRLAGVHSDNVADELRAIFGEALHDFGGSRGEPGL